MKMRLMLLSSVSAMLLILTVMPLASAEILISQVGNVYNIGDELSVDITLAPSIYVNDFLRVDISCGTENVNIYNQPYEIDSGEEQDVSVIVPALEKSIIGSLIGNCHLQASYGEENVNSQDFILTNEININLNLAQVKYNPGETVDISGSALKLNGEAVEGFVEIVIEDLDLLIVKTINDVNFAINFTLLDDSPGGVHSMNVRVYEKDLLGEISNEGIANEMIDISQVLTSLEININPQTVSPGDEFTYSVIPKDQSGAAIDYEVGITIYKPGDFIFLEKVINSGEEYSIKTDSNTTPGYWQVEAIVEELSSKKLFYLEEHKEIHSSLIGDTLIVTNIGNVRYRGPIEILIGSVTEVKHLDLNVHETKKFKLSAPDGNYLIGLSEGNNEETLGNTFLTGRVIEVGEIRDGLIGSLYSPLLWLLAILLLALIIVFFVRRRKSKGKTPVLKADKKDVKHNSIKGAMIKEGKKEEASVVALKINNKEISSSISDSIDKTLIAAKGVGAKIYTDGNYRIILFSPSLTKYSENSMVVIAVKVAKKIEAILNDHNRKSREVIDFGIGLNNGGIISEITQGKFIFTSVGGVITGAKKIAALSKKEVLLSDSMRKRVLGKVNTEKVKGKDVWKVTKIPDREKHKGFLSRSGKKD